MVHIPSSRFHQNPPLHFVQVTSFCHSPSILILKSNLRFHAVSRSHLTNVTRLYVTIAFTSHPTCNHQRMSLPTRPAICYTHLFDFQGPRRNQLRGKPPEKSICNWKESPPLKDWDLPLMDVQNNLLSPFLKVKRSFWTMQNSMKTTPHVSEQSIWELSASWIAHFRGTRFVTPQSGCPVTAQNLKTTCKRRVGKNRMNDNLWDVESQTVAVDGHNQQLNSCKFGTSWYFFPLHSIGVSSDPRWCFPPKHISGPVTGGMNRDPCCCGWWLQLAMTTQNLLLWVGKIPEWSFLFGGWEPFLPFYL